MPETDQPKSWEDLKLKVNQALHPTATDPKLSKSFDEAKRETDN